MLTKQNMPFILSHATVKLAGEARKKRGTADGRYLVVEDSFMRGKRVS